MKRYLRTAFISLLACVLLFGFVSVSFAQPTLRVYFRRLQVGGTEALDNVPYATLIDAQYNTHFGIICTDSKELIFYWFDTTSSASEDSPLYEIIAPNDEAGNGRWAKVTSLAMGRTTNQKNIFRSSAATIIGDNAETYITVTDPDDGEEDIDYCIGVQIAGAMTDVFCIDADGNIEMALDVDVASGKTYKIDGTNWAKTTVGDPGVDTLIVTEQGIREALDAVSGTTSIDGTPGSSGTYVGITITGVNAGETITAGDIVYMDGTTAEWMLADANVAGEFPAIGMAAEGGTDTNPMDVLIQGVARLDSWTWTDEGVPLYLSETPGGMTETPPSDADDCVQVVATVLAITNDTILFKPDSSWFLDDGS